jgi:hypothetical protein
MWPSGCTITPDPSARCTCVCGARGAPPPKNWRKNGSSKNGNCCAALTRRDARMVTTAGATRSTMSA